MACVRDEFGFEYDVVSTYRNGHMILYQLHGSTCPWIIRTPDDKMIRFETESDLWQHALKNKLFRKRKGKKNG